MIICLKGISEECFSFNFNVNASLKAFEGHSSTWGLRGHLGTRRALKGHSDTRTLIEHSGTWTLRHLGTRHILFSRLAAPGKLNASKSFNSRVILIISFVLVNFCYCPLT